MLPDFTNPADWLPWAFASLMGLSILIYVILDGFDLGVGILFPLAEPEERDRMIGSIGPFWDANETWLVLAVGLLLVAFPVAHGMILSTLYLPVFIMLVGLILRGVAFEFRAKARDQHKRLWNRLFFVGSLGTALAQGWMLGMYVMGLETTLATYAFAALTAVFLAVGYSFIGSTWLIHKTEGALQLKAVQWGRESLWGVVLGIGAVSLATPFVSARIFEKWFTYPEVLYLAPLPVLAGALVVALWVMLRRMPYAEDRRSWLPFAVASTLFALAYLGMAYSFYPYVVPERLTIYEARSGARKPADHPDRRLLRGAGDPRVFGAGLCHIPRQGDGVALRLRSRLRIWRKMKDPMHVLLLHLSENTHATLPPCGRPVVRNPPPPPAGSGPSSGRATPAARRGWRCSTDRRPAPSGPAVSCRWETSRGRSRARKSRAPRGSRCAATGPPAPGRPCACCASAAHRDGCAPRSSPSP